MGDDWDDDSPATNQPSAPGLTAVVQGFQQKPSGGFGGFSSGGPGSFEQNNNGFFGSGMSFPSSTDSGFGSGTRGGGGDKKGCFKCGEEGHISRDCPSGGGRTGGKGCFKCGEQGHMSRDCPSGGGGPTVGDKGCFKCGEQGHMSRDCPSGGGRTGGKGCFKCGEEGHMSRDCPKGGSGAGRGKGCFKCGEEGHMSRDCTKLPGGFGAGGDAGGTRPGFGGFGANAGGGFGENNRVEPRGGGFGDGLGVDSADKKSGCFKCGKDGHIARECPDAASAAASADVNPDGEKRPPPYIPPPPPDDEEHIFETLMKGINFDKYDNIPVECTGRAAPKHGLPSFMAADISDVLKENVKKTRYDKPTPIQKWAIPVILSGRDLMACAQTGSGKTAAFLLPVLSGMLRNGIEGSAFSVVQEPQTVVVGPTRELVTQIHHEARKFAYNTIVRSVVVYGGVTSSYQAREVGKGAHLVVGTPGRLMDFVRRGYISLAKVKYLILDEADRMLDMGFLPEMKKLVHEMGMPPKTDRQTLMFSATFPDEVQKLARDMLNDYIFVTVGRVGGANVDIEQRVLQVDRLGKREQLVSILNEQGRQRTLIFVEQKRMADFLASFLSQSDFPTTSIHGDREQREREEALRDFKNGSVPILVATSVAARGLDIAGVNHVINFEMPSSIEEYVHRIGRTGRCGNTGRATCLFDPQTDAGMARPLVKVLVDAQQEIPDWLEALAAESYGSGGFTNNANQFKDTRRGNFSETAAPAPRVFGSAPPAAAAPAPAAGDDEDDWD